MNILAKMLIGVVLVIASLWYIFFGVANLLPPAWPDVLTVLNGAIPPFLILLGIFIVWLEYDEWKIEKELREEEEKEKRGRKRRRK